VWVLLAGSRYRKEYAQATESWLVGTTRMVELTLVKDDRRNLACASDQVMAGLRCGFRGDLQEAGPSLPDDPHILQPFNTVKGELLMGAGLWRCPDFEQSVPESRFTAVCNYHIAGVVKSASLRFDIKNPFTPLGKTVTVGTLTDCVIPR
jgi:hypothetical protein